MTKLETSGSAGSAARCLGLHDEMDGRPTTQRSVWVQRGLVVAIWVVILIAWRRFQTNSGLSTVDTAQRFIDDVDGAWWGIAAFVGLYLIRPIVLFPASVLTVVGGVLFGPYLGVIVVVVAANTSAMIAYGIGRVLGRPPASVDVGQVDATSSTSFASRWAGRLRDNSFETVLVMRLLFLPYDLVNYMCGVLRIRWAPFLVATALGSIPGTVSFVLLGASLERVDEGLDGLDPAALIVGVVIFVAALAVARTLRHRTEPTELEFT